MMSRYNGIMETEEVKQTSSLHEVLIYFLSTSPLPTAIIAMAGFE
jgi:hypothetical protein